MPESHFFTSESKIYQPFGTFWNNADVINLKFLFRLLYFLKLFFISFSKMCRFTGFICTLVQLLFKYFKTTRSLCPLLKTVRYPKGSHNFDSTSKMTLEKHHIILILKYRHIQVLFLNYLYFPKNLSWQKNYPAKINNFFILE